MSRSRYLTIALIIVLGATVLRTLWLRADPPTTSVGIVFHDEGPWTHNARNQALWGVWQTDNWNPVYIAPVFTALEYVAFEAFGVGTWQARTVPAASGIAAVILLMMGLSALAGRRIALIGGALLAVEYTWVMWNRAALMESTMTAFIVAGWAAYALGSKRPIWGFVAGLATALAWFTKAAAAFFAAAIVLDALVTLAASRPALRSRLGMTAPANNDVRAAVFTLAGMTVAFGAIGLAFVVPHWNDYWFYNVQMSVERKPSYDLASLQYRATMLGVVQDIFTRMWPLLVLAAAGILGIFVRWRDAKPGERLLALWVLVGWLELVVHDSSTERRYVMFVPAVIALASLVLGSGASILPARATSTAASWRSRLITLPVWLGLAYVTFGSGLRPFLLAPGTEHPYSLAVRVATALAAVTVLCALVWWPAIARTLSSRGIGTKLAGAIILIMLAWNLGQYARWAAHHDDVNYRASMELGRLLPPGTLVQGKLANGLALDNRIRPIFVGNGFGNYADRFDRNDVRYILTYDLPWVGYESQRGLIEEILDRYPNRQSVATFVVDETPGADRAVLIDKHPPGLKTRGSAPAAASGLHRARD